MHFKIEYHCLYCNNYKVELQIYRESKQSYLTNAKLFPIVRLHMSLRYRFFNYLKQNQVLLALVSLIVGWFVLQTHSIWVSLFLSYIITTALLPFVAYLQKLHFPKIAAILIPYFSTIIIIAFLVSVIVNSFIPELNSLVHNLPILLDKSAKSLNIPLGGIALQGQLTNDASAVGQNAFNLTTKVFGGVFSVITILIVSFYLLLYHEAFHGWVSGLFGIRYNKHAKEVLEQVDDKLGAWARGQIVLSFCIGLAVFLALSLLQVPYALPLGIMAGLFEFIPTLGPTLAAIPSIIIALTISPSLAIAVLALYIAIQFLENHLLVPKIMQKAVGLNPIMVILGIAIGANLLGIPGALLAVPFISFTTVLINGVRSVNYSRLTEAT